MLNHQLKTNIFSLCKAEGIEQAELYYRRTTSVKVNIENEEVDTCKQSDEEGLNISGNYQGQYAATYIEKLDEASAKAAITYLKEAAQGNQKPIRNSHLAKVNETHSKVEEKQPLNEIIKELIAAQGKIKDMDARIDSVTETSYIQTTVEIQLYDEKEGCLKDTYEYCKGSVGVVVEEDGIRQNASAWELSGKFEKIDYLALGKKAVTDATALLKAAPIYSGTYPVILQNNVAANLISYILPIFFQDTLEKGTGKYAGKIGTKVATEKFTLVEDPQLPSGGVKRSFDDEGTATNKKYIIQNGILKNIVNRSANKEATLLTGNGFRESYKTNVGTGVTNCYVEKGTRTTETILKDLTECVIITDADGLFAGINVNTGDFSLISSGYYRKKGQADRPVKQITIGGNFYQLFQEIQELSQDTAASESEEQYVESPSIYLKQLMIGGL
ncbi:MAG: TldD/PmbA family protein [Lachnospiraceae bacterium]